MLPYSLTEQERHAARNVGLRDPPKETPVEPIVTGKWAVVAGVLATGLGFVAAWAPNLTFLPPWVPFALWALAGVAALLAGVAVPAFKGTSPTVPQVLVPVCLALATALQHFAGSLSPGTVQSLVLFGSLLLFALGGKALPTPELPAGGTTFRGR